MNTQGLYALLLAFCMFARGYPYSVTHLVNCRLDRQNVKSPPSPPPSAKLIVLDASSSSRYYATSEGI